MGTIDKSLIASAADSWRKACARLQVRVESPYTLVIGEELVSCLAFLPDFGGGNGIVVVAMDLPKIGPDEHLESILSKCKITYSFVNVSAFARADVSEDIFKRALEDWGYYGSQDNCPVWYKSYKGNRALP